MKTMQYNRRDFLKTSSRLAAMMAAGIVGI
ncbi:MAG: twin-arginine translocation signal domain-containing protein [Bacteroidetes bacterium]|nr:twin-arginine translocation signal domain-containing protein [Bacteroidota bacterium]